MDDLINKIGSIADDLTGSDILDFISEIGCLSSNYRKKHFKERFPQQIEQMRIKSGVNVAMTSHNVLDFVKRIYHFKAAFEDNDIKSSSCRKPYAKAGAKAMQKYVQELTSLLTNAGFVQTGTATTTMAQLDIDPIEFADHTKTFEFPLYAYQGSGNDYTTIGSGNTGDTGGSGSTEYSPITAGVSPTLNKFSISQFAIGGLLAYGLYIYAKDNNFFKK